MAAIIGITVDKKSDTDRYSVTRYYAEAVVRAGGVPLFLPYEAECIGDYLKVCDGFVLTGGGDPDMTEFGEKNHAQAKVIVAERQRFDLAMIAALDDTMHPVLAICLNMQLMVLHHGGKLEQHLADLLGTERAARHIDKHHDIKCTIKAHKWLPVKGKGYSYHHQAIADVGQMRVCAVSDDGVIEAVDFAESERFYMGTQWHPERTDDEGMGIGMFKGLIEACGQ